MRILGAEKVHFSYEYLHPDYFKIVQHFERQGLVESWPYFNPSGIKDAIKRNPQDWMLQVNMINDCFYRVINLYEFVAVIDFDEVFIPLNENDMNWQDMMKRINGSDDDDFYVFQNIRFPGFAVNPQPDVPIYMHMLQNTQRMIKYKKNYKVKSLVRSETVKFPHNHYALSCFHINYKCKKHEVSEEVAQLSHYRSSDKDYKKVFVNETKPDLRISKFKDRLIKAVERTIKATGFKPWLFDESFFNLICLIVLKILQSFFIKEHENSTFSTLKKGNKSKKWKTKHNSAVFN